MRIPLLIAAFAVTACSSTPPDGSNNGASDSGDSGVDASADMAASDMVAADMAVDQAADGASDTDNDDMASDSADLGGDPLMASTQVVNGRLRLDTNLRGDMLECPSAAGVPCEDVDQDELVDAWEDLILERFRPRLVFDEAEELFNDPNAVVVHVGRVAPFRRNPLTIQVYITILYDRDYGACGTLSSHNGDSERVVLILEEDDDGVIVDRVHTAAHEGTITDHSMQLIGDELRQLEYDETVVGEARWVVYPSKNKHATYITKAVCEGISPIPCFDEDCGPDSGDPAMFTMLADVHNAGEPDAPRLGDLTAIGFPGEDAWADQSFCGGHDRNLLCPGGIFEKLLTNPFQ